jgi:hypothetical protein
MPRYPSIRQWTLFGLLLVAVSLLGISPQAEADDNGGAKETFQIMPLDEAPDSPDEATGAVRLNRTRNELWASFHVTELEPRSAFTIWAAIFNRPEECITNPAADVRCGLDDLFAVPNPARASVFNVGAFVTGDDGTANINIHLRSGAPPDGAFVLVGEGGLIDNGVRPGLREGNGFGAEVHLVIRTHGEILPHAIAAQLSEFNGGCPDQPPPDNLPCIDVQMATFPRVTD